MNSWTSQPRPSRVFRRATSEAILKRVHSGRYQIAHAGEVVAVVRSVAGLRDIIGTTATAMQDPAIISMAYPVLGEAWLADRVGREADIEIEIRDQANGQVFDLLVTAIADPHNSGITYEAVIGRAEERKVPRQSGRGRGPPLGT